MLQVRSSDNPAALDQCFSDPRSAVSPFPYLMFANDMVNHKTKSFIFTIFEIGASLCDLKLIFVRNFARSSALISQKEKKQLNQCKYFESPTLLKVRNSFKGAVTDRFRGFAMLTHETNLLPNPNNLLTRPL